MLHLRIKRAKDFRKIHAFSLAPEYQRLQLQFPTFARDLSFSHEFRPVVANGSGFGIGLVHFHCVRVEKPEQIER